MAGVYIEDIFRHVTPPQDFGACYPGSSESQHSAQPSFTFSSGSSPASQLTPPHSPVLHHGPMLLPKVRSQDQIVDPVPEVQHYSSMKTSTGFPPAWHDHFEARGRPGAVHRSLSPSSNPSHIANCRSRTASPLPPSGLAPRQGAGVWKQHARATSIDAAALRKYMAPVRSLSPYVQHRAASASTSHARAVSLATSAAIGIQPRQSPVPDFLAPELQFDSYARPPPATTLSAYLASANPAPGLVKRLAPPNRSDPFFWFDVRNLRAWSDFSIATIRAVPGLTSLLDLPIPEPALPAPTRPDAQPDSLAALKDTYAASLLPKVNAALRVALGDSHLCIAPTDPAAASSTRPRPDFTANYASDAERTLYGATRARVVGLTKSFQSWNSGMRTTDTVAYQRALAQLQFHMREHGCRYGFLITEIELVAVRLGTDAVPFFGLVEVSAPVALAETGPGGGAKMTAPLALWWLHLLAKEEPVPGQAGWKVDVGAPAALTRQKALARDAWMLKAEGKEKRDAKRVRGWVWPEEGLSRREMGGRRR